LFHDAMDYTPYEGIAVKGWPVITISRGEVVAENGKVVETRGRGKFLPCERSALAKPLGRRVTRFDPVTGRLANL
jgi:dihydropyrimidinase